MSRRTKFLLLFAFVTLIGVGLFLRLRPRPYQPIPISRETTYFTEPVRDDGTVDYNAAFEDMLAEGVTPENNIAVPLAKAFGEGYLNSDTYSALGINEAELGPPLYTPAVYIWEHDTRDIDAFTADTRDMSVPQFEPWRSWEYPEVAEWLEASAASLSHLEEAARRERYFVPGSSPQGAGFLLLSRGDPLVARGGLHDGLVPLYTRALLRFGKGRHPQAFADLGRVWTLLANLTREMTSSDVQDAASREMPFALDAFGVLLSQSGLTSELLADVRTQLADTPAPDGHLERLALARRTEVLSNLRVLRTEGVDALFDLHTPAVDLQLRRIDPLSVMRFFDDLAPRIVAAHKYDTYPERKRAADRIANELSAAHKEAEAGQSGPFLRALVDPVADPILFFQASDIGVSWVYRYDLVIIARRRVLDAAFAAAIYRADHGTLPDSLGVLVPDYCDGLPIDPFDELPLKLRRTPFGVVIYSVGEDLTDDGGSPEDDIAIRIEPKRWPLRAVRPATIVTETSSE